MALAITLEALRVLDAIDRKGSFGAAALALHKVPSALSYTIQKLETDLNISIFDRSKQRAQLTNAGRLLLEQGRELLKAASALEDAVQQLEAGWEMQLRIAKDSILPLTPLLEVVQAFALLDKRVTIDIQDEVLGGTWESLISDRCDLALGAAGELAKGVYDYQQIGEAEFIFAVAKDHPLRQHQGPVDSAAIRAFPTIVTADSSLNMPSRSVGILESRQTIRVANTQAKIAAQCMGLGVGFLATHLIQNELKNGQLVALDCSIPRARVPLYMAWKKGNNGKALAWFINACSHKRWL